MEAPEPAVTGIELALVPKRIADALGRDIVFGRLAPESRIVEEELAARFGVSRSPVREAIRLLERDGLAVRAERKGARVSALGRKDLDEVYGCRIALEGIAAAEAAAHHEKAHLKRLQSEVARLRKAFQRTDVVAYFEANVAFTEIIHEASGNRTVARLLGTLDRQSLRYRYLAYRNFPHLMSSSLEGNQDLVAAITARDAEEARRQTETLIRRSWETIRSCVPE